MKREIFTANVELMDYSIPELKAIFDFSLHEVRMCDKIINSWFESKTMKDEFKKLRKKYLELYHKSHSELQARLSGIHFE